MSGYLSGTEPFGGNLLQPGRGGNNGTSSYPDPFLDIASQVMPKTMPEILRLCEFVWHKNGIYRMAASRIVRYFITSVEFDGIDREQRQRLLNFLSHRLRVTERLAELGDDFIAYGNSFSSVVVPFRRYLRCSECALERPIDKVEYTFKDFKFMAVCPSCGTKRPIEHTRIDRPSMEEDKIAVKRWAPFEIEIEEHPLSKTKTYYWRIPPKIRKRIKEGDRTILDEMPWEVVEAVRDEKLFKFNRGVVYHMCESTLAGVNSEGWGLSRLFSTFGLAWYVQMMHRFNEALVSDYIVPFRVISPPAATGKLDPILHTDMDDFRGNVNAMVREHRRDPGSYHTAPMPLNYQVLGGEANNLAPYQLLEQGNDVLMNAIGTPVEMYRGSMSMQAMPTAMRLFQQMFPQIPGNYSGWLDWAIQIICSAMLWDKPDRAYMKPVTLADDIEIRQVWLQLASANLISKRTAYGPWNIDPGEETERVFDEMREFDEIRKKYEEDAQSRQVLSEMMMGQPPQGAGGDPGAPGAAMGAQGGVAPLTAQGASTPQELHEEAMAMASELLAMPYEDRRRMMYQLKQQHPQLHALVKQEMENQRQAAASEGQQMVLQGGA